MKRKERKTKKMNFLLKNKKSFFLKILKRKQKGIVDKVVPLILTIMTVLILMLVSINWTEKLKIKSEINQIGRQYLLKMEANGFLTPADQAEMQTALEAMGITVTNWGDTDLSQVPYGQTITLEISGTVELRSYDVKSLFNASEKNEIIPFKIFKKSTAKW